MLRKFILPVIEFTASFNSIIWALYCCSVCCWTQLSIILLLAVIPTTGDVIDAVVDDVFEGNIGNLTIVILLESSFLWLITKLSPLAEVWDDFLPEWLEEDFLTYII